MRGKPMSVATDLVTGSSGAPNVSGTYAVAHVGARRMPPLPHDAQPVVDTIDRIAELEQQLAQAREEIASLKRERDELRARLEPETMEALDAELEVLEPPPLPLSLAPSLPPSLAPSLPSLAPSLPPSLAPSLPPSIEPPPVSLEPVSLSRLVISTPPARPSASEPPPDLFADGDRPSQLGDRPSSIERRRRARLGCEFEVEFLGDTHLIAGLSQDISEGGVFVATYQRLIIGSTISLGLELPSGRVEVRGQVRWERGEIEDSDQRPGFGVAFTELSPEALAALTEFCRQHPAHYYEM